MQPSGLFSVYHSVGNLAQALGEDYTDRSQNKNVELPSFRLAKIAKYTNNFSVSNKLGEGGFGPVYKVNYLLMPICV